jgi:hypothetical protein
MSRATFAERIWWETDVPVFFEKFILPFLATSIVVLIWTNPMKFDWPSRIGLCIGLFAFAYVAAHQIHLRNEVIRTGQPPIGIVAPEGKGQQPTTGAATATGTGNGANSGNGGTVNVNTGDAPDKEPKKK